MEQLMIDETANAVKQAINASIQREENNIEKVTAKIKKQSNLFGAPDIALIVERECCRARQNAMYELLGSLSRVLK